MATIAIVTTAAQDSALAQRTQVENDRIVARNAVLPPGTPPEAALTPATYLRKVVGTLLDNWSDDIDRTQRQQLLVAWQDPVKQAAIKAAAGIP